jgi:hypothetical protein
MIFCTPEYGAHGPVVGTIHASKGREADDVYLFLPPDARDALPTDEEIRVMFVGATRSRKSLIVGEGSDRRAGSANGRVWRRISGGRIQVEIGRVHDLEADGLVGTHAFPDPNDALQSQQGWIDKPFRIGLCARKEASLAWRFALSDKTNLRLALLGVSVDEDLSLIARQTKTWPPPNFLPHVRSVGLRSVVVAPDSPLLDKLHEPWRSSGFMVAPLLLGFCPAYITGKKNP